MLIARTNCDDCEPLSDNELALMEMPARFLDLIERAAEGREVQFELDSLVMDMRIATGRAIAGPNPGLFFSPNGLRVSETNQALPAMAGER